ncbi:MAG: hypothetical protein V6Z81_00360 [Parvularculales bacterium]
MQDLPDKAAQRLLTIMDPVHGGVKGAPKFPQPMILELIWRVGVRTNDTDLQNAVTRALDGMCAGGIYDHLGGGFARYSTDEEVVSLSF